ncbi:ABC transporter substrate-binding protein [Pseudomonas sp. RIT-PI-S]|uniref:ABC transporter substrate-binding protein n=1 Tax=Pseudomonas sp. RIT-PI-S TaxID=3035295 RepID=UPI0021D8CF41|nr:ABC transporter substrate-binding protein [Pseudomonas sp. RIT-PI-S]
MPAVARLLRSFAPVVLSGVLSALAGPSYAQDLPTEIRIAVPDLSAGTDHSGGGVVDVLRDQQLLEKEFAADGIKVQWLFFKGAGPVINEALANGQVDFAYLGDLAAIIGKASGLDTRLLSGAARRVKSYLGVVPGSGVKTLEDLKGKQVAVFRGTASQLSFDAALASRGLSERDLKVVNLDFSAANAALAARQIDATWGNAGLIALRERGLAELPLSTADLGGAGDLQGVLVGTGQFIDHYPQVTERLLRAQQQALNWLAQPGHKQAYVELVSRLANYPAVILATDVEGEDFSRQFDPKLDQDFLGRLQTAVDFAGQQRLIRAPFQVTEWAQPRFLDAALQASGAAQAAR